MTDAEQHLDALTVDIVRNLLALPEDDQHALLAQVVALWRYARDRRAGKPDRHPFRGKAA